MKFFFLILAGFSSYSLETLILSPGEKTVIPAPYDQKIRVGNKAILQLEQKGSGVLIFARSKGESLLVAGSKRYRLLILSPNKKEQARSLSKLLQAMRGLKWTFFEEGFQIQGELYRFSDWLDLAKHSKKHNLKYEFKAQMDEELKKVSLYYFQKILGRPLKIFWRELPSVRLPQKAPLLLYQNLLKPFGLIPREQEGWFFKAPFIQIEWAVVESLSSSSIEGALSKKWSSLPLFLNFIKSSGWGKSLHRSFVLAQSGQVLQLEAGGQIPFSQYNFKTEQESLSWKSYGWSLNLIPTLDVHRQIHLKMKARLSEPLSFSSSSPPPLKNQKIETEMVLEPLEIVKLFEWRKSSRGRHYGFKFNSLPTLFGGPNRYKSNQSIFLQMRILDKGGGSDAGKGLSEAFN